MDNRLRIYWSRLDKEVRRTIIYTTIIIVSVIAFTTVFRRLVLGGPFQLAVTPTTTSDQITQAIKGRRMVDGVITTSTTFQGSPPSQNTGDYKVDTIRYFQGADWVVADLHPKKAADQTLVIIMRRDGAQYSIAMGPGTNFPRGALESIQAPSGLINYLDERGFVSIIGG